MSYKLKEEKAEEIKKKYKNSYFIDNIGISACYVSLVLNRKRDVSKKVAYCFTKLIDSEAEISDFFEVE